MKNEQTIKSILDWFKLAKPNPTQEDVNTQLSCHIEEFREMLKAMDYDSPALAILQAQLRTADQKQKQDNIADKKEMLDALCDQIVTALGVGYMLGFDMEKALAEVNRSNWSKFENGKPIFNEYGKIMKGKDYSKPVLNKFLGEYDENL